MSEKQTATVVIAEIAEPKSGTTKKGKPYTRYALKDANGEWWSTFQQNIFEPAHQLVGQKALIGYEVDGSFKNIVSIEPHGNGSSVPESYSHTKPTGEPDWDRVALGKTRCSLWGAFLGGHLASSMYIKVSDKPDAVDGVLRAGQAFVVAAEKDIFERPPGGDGIPF